MREITSVEWKGHKIEFVPVLSHRYLWMATTNELWFDGKLVATSGGFNFASQVEATVPHESSSVSILVKSSTCWKTLIDLNYDMRIDGESVSKGIAKTQIRW